MLLAHEEGLPHGHTSPYGIIGIVLIALGILLLLAFLDQKNDK